MNPHDRRNKLWQIRDVSEAIRSEPVQAPDLTAAILDRVDAQRPFLAPSVRRRIPLVYGAVALSITTCVLTFVLLHRAAPNAVQFAAEPAPISTFANTVECAACRKIDAFRQSISSDSIHAPDPEALLSTVAAVASVIELENPAAADFAETSGSTVTMRSTLRTHTQAVAIAGSSEFIGPVRNEPRLAPVPFRLAMTTGAQSIVPSLPGDPLPRAVLFSGEVPASRFASHARPASVLDADLATLPR